MTVTARARLFEGIEDAVEDGLKRKRKAKPKADLERLVAYGSRIEMPDGTIVLPFGHPRAEEVRALLTPQFTAAYGSRGLMPAAIFSRWCGLVDTARMVGPHRLRFMLPTSIEDAGHADMLAMRQACQSTCGRFSAVSRWQRERLVVVNRMRCKSHRHTTGTRPCAAEITRERGDLMVRQYLHDQGKPEPQPWVELTLTIGKDLGPYIQQRVFARGVEEMLDCVRHEYGDYASTTYNYYEDRRVKRAPTVLERHKERLLSAKWVKRDLRTDTAKKVATTYISPMASQIRDRLVRSWAARARRKLGPRKYKLHAPVVRRHLVALPAYHLTFETDAKGYIHAHLLLRSCSLVAALGPDPEAPLGWQQASSQVSRHEAIAQQLSAMAVKLGLGPRLSVGVCRSVGAARYFVGDTTAKTGETLHDTGEARGGSGLYVRGLHRWRCSEDWFDAPEPPPPPPKHGGKRPPLRPPRPPDDVSIVGMPAGRLARLLFEHGCEFIDSDQPILGDGVAPSTNTYEDPHPYVDRFVLGLPPPDVVDFESKKPAEDLPWLVHLHVPRDLIRRVFKPDQED